MMASETWEITSGGRKVQAWPNFMRLSVTEWARKFTSRMMNHRFGSWLVKGGARRGGAACERPGLTVPTAGGFRPCGGWS